MEQDGGGSGGVGGSGGGAGSLYEAGTEAGPGDIDAWGRQLRLYLAGPAEPSAGMDIDAPGGMVIGRDREGVLGIPGTGDQGIGIRPEEICGVGDEAAAGKPDRSPAWDP